MGGGMGADIGAVFRAELGAEIADAALVTSVAWLVTRAVPWRLSDVGAALTVEARVEAGAGARAETEVETSDGFCVIGFVVAHASSPKANTMVMVKRLKNLSKFIFMSLKEPESSSVFS